MSSKQYLEKYLQSYDLLINEPSAVNELINIKEIFKKASHEGKKIILAGNGGSAAMASHVAVDITKNAGIRAVTFNEYDLITTLANDYGYENWISKGIELFHNHGDIVVLISASGQSKNVINAAKYSKTLGLKTITFSGFKNDNSLKQLGDINLWVNNPIYNVVEMTHHIWLLAIIDMIIDENK